jgi:hypothetical protein
MQNVEKLGLLSLKTAKRLFAIKITLILTYGIERILEHLTEGNLTILESAKAKCLKMQFICQDSWCHGSHTYTLARELFLTKELRNEWQPKKWVRG